MEHGFSAAGAPDYPLTRIPCRGSFGANLGGKSEPERPARE
jgi:hypothetical protein